jgi:hypothetical protein
MRISRLIYTFLFIIGALVLSWFYNYFEILFWQPQGIHFMRQTDCLSFISYYAKTGAPLWEPGLLCLYSNEGKTASEFPVVYYLLSFVWKYFGKQEFLLRLFNLLVFFTGVYHLHKLFKQVLQKWHVSLFAIMLIITSPVIVYYANNFLPDISAMALTFIAMRYSYDYFTGHEKRNLILALLHYTFAALLKISYFIYPAAFIGVVVINAMLQKKKLSSLLLPFLLFMLSLVMAAGWAYYVVQYNKLHNGYFLSNAKPIWILDDEYRESVWKHLGGYWMGWHYPVLTTFTFPVLTLITLIFFKKLELTWRLWVSFALAGAVAFFLLFFAQLRDHDYYILTFVPALALLTVFAIKSIQLRFEEIWYVRSFTFVLLAYLVFSGMLKTQNYVRWRYWDCSINDPFARIGRVLINAEKEMDDAGISQDARIVFIHDAGFSGCTYFSNRFGWQLGDNYMNELDRIDLFKKQGATHLAIIDTADFNNEILLTKADSLVMETNDYKVYTLK